MTLKISLMISASLLPLSTCLPQRTEAQPQMTQKQAAATFQRFSLSVAGDSRPLAFTTSSSQAALLASVAYHEPDKAPDDPTNDDLLTVLANHPHGYWQIERHGSFDMEVDDTTGHVINYSDDTALTTDSNLPASEAVPKSQAIKIAEAAVRATGASLNIFTLNGVVEYQNSDPPKAIGHEWYVCWLRTFRSIPYRRQGAGVFLAAETGRVLSVRVDEQYTDPLTAVEKMTREQASQVAEAQLTAVGLTASSLPVVRVQKEIVPFNHFWQTGDESHHSLQTRVVWSVECGVPGDTLEVWVDSETGDVVGGYHVSSLGRGAMLPALKFGHQLKHRDIPLKAK